MAAPASLAARAQRDPGLLKRALADPGLRSKLPSSMLTTAQRRARAVNAQAAQRQADQSAFTDVSRPLSGSALTTAANQITAGQYDPQFAELDSQQKQIGAQRDQSLTRERAIYDQLQKFAASQLAAQQSASTQNRAAIGNNTTTALGQLDAAGQQVQAQQAQDAAVRGSGLDGGSDARLAADQSALRAQIAGTGQIAGNLSSQNADALSAVLTGIGMATQARGAEQAGAIDTAARNSLSDLASKRQALQEKRGGSLADTLMKLRQQGADEYYTAAGLDLNQAKEVQAAHEAGVKHQEAVVARRNHAAEAKRSADITKRGQTLSHNDRAAALAERRTEAKNRATGKTPGSKKPVRGPGALTASQENTAWNRIGRASSALRGLIGSPQGAKLTDQQLIDGLVADPKSPVKGVSPEEAYIALSLARHNGKMSDAAVQKAHQLSLHIGNRYPVIPVGGK